MDPRIRSINMKFSQLAKREDELYHQYALFCGLSDPAVWVLYTLYEDEGCTYTQHDLASLWSFPKQTLNYTVNTLVKQDWVRLEQLPGARNSKAIRLTKAGEKLCEEKILPLMLAEEHSLSHMTETEQDLLLELFEKQCHFFEEEIQILTGGSDKKDL